MLRRGPPNGAIRQPQLCYGQITVNGRCTRGKHSLVRRDSPHAERGCMNSQVWGSDDLREQARVDVVEEAADRDMVADERMRLHLRDVTANRGRLVVDDAE